MTGMTPRLSIELAVSVLSAGMALFTLAWPEWVELLLHVDPDGGNGAVEWAIVGLFAVVTLVCLALAGSSRLEPARRR